MTATRNIPAESDLAAWRALDKRERDRFYDDVESIKSWEREANDSTHALALLILRAAAEPEAKARTCATCGGRGYMHTIEAPGREPCPECSGLKR